MSKRPISLTVEAIRRDMARNPSGRGGELHFIPSTPSTGRSGCPGDNLVAEWDELAEMVHEPHVPTTEQIAEVVAVAQNVPFVGPKQRKIADAVLELLQSGANQ